MYLGSRKLFFGILLSVCFFCMFYFFNNYLSKFRSSPIELCKSDDKTIRNNCYSDLIIQTFHRKGLSSALDEVATIADNDKLFSESCHETMHTLGKLSYEIYKKTGKIEVNDKLSYCNFGFYHSFIEVMVAETGGIDTAQRFCQQIGNNGLDLNRVSNCYHGIGHGVSSEPAVVGSSYEMSLPGLSLRGKISDEAGFRRSCQLGVFNSIVLLYDNPKYKLSKPDNAYALCTNVRYNKGEKEACYLEMTTLSLQLLDNNIDKALITGLKTDPEFTSQVVHDTALYGIKENDPQQTIDSCRKNTPQYIKECIQGTAAGLKVFGDLGNEYKRDIDFYRVGKLTSLEKSIFLNYLLVVDVNSQTEQKVVCNKFPKDLQIGPCKVN